MALKMARMECTNDSFSLFFGGGRTKAETFAAGHLRRASKSIVAVCDRRNQAKTPVMAEPFDGICIPLNSLKTAAAAP